jgi:hypothetical protein
MTSKILIACEFSGAIRDAMIEAGHDAVSCDLLPSESDKGPHIQGDVTDVIQSQHWALIIAHFPCTALALSGNRWYGRGMPRHAERLAAIDWTVGLWELCRKHSDHAALENPASVLFQHLPKDSVQYVQPWQYGHGETKRTGFALHNLPDLTPTDIVSGRADTIHKMAPGPNRWRERSRTFSGIASAIADQWGGVL